LLFRRYFLTFLFSYADILARKDCAFGAGGAALNTVRAAAWMIQEGGVASYVGCVGEDKSSEILRFAFDYCPFLKKSSLSYFPLLYFSNVLSEGNVEQHFVSTKEAATGTCAVLIVDKERSMVTRLGAAEKFTDAAFQSEEVQKHMKAAKLYFSTGFFLSVVPNSLVSMGKLSTEQGKVCFLFSFRGISSFS
jgi:adenosine kinase